MEEKLPPHCTGDAQSLLALTNELKSMLSSPAMDNGAVVVGLLPKRRCCCAGSSSHCQVAEPREYKETGEDKEIHKGQGTQEHKGFRHGIEIREITGIREGGHSLEGIWEVYPPSSSNPSLVWVYTVQGNPGQLYGTKLTVSRVKQTIFHFSTGDGTFKHVLGGSVLILNSCE